jgi:SAM-dependent methyltransferase
MSEPAPLTNKSAYETRRDDGEIYGAIGPRDWNRFKQTLRLIPTQAESMLDAGCDRGHWLSYVAKHRKLQRLLGVDVSEARIEEARQRYGNVEFQAGYLEQLDIGGKSFDVVTSLEVLEHIPDWTNVLDRLLEIARRRVVITVPYRERVIQTICIHCGQLTPLYGHLRSFNESTFPLRPGWSLRFGYILDYGIGGSPARRLYRLLRPRRNWLVAIYDAAS